MTDDNQKTEAPSLLQVFGSVLGSFFGVQKSETRERDFRHGKPGQFIFVGLVLTLVFVLAVWGLVKLALNLVIS